MKKQLSILFALIGWFAIIIQLCLMFSSTLVSVPETIIRFFSYFTILTNIIVASYFTQQALQNRPSRPGVLTAITIYITIVGLVYQLLLRHIWSPKGLNKLVDELLHSVIPILTIIYWYCYENKRAIRYGQIPKWLLYPAIYLIYSLIRGHFTGWYPYHFIDVPTLSLTRVLINIILLLLGGSLLSALFIFLGRVTAKKSTK